MSTVLRTDRLSLRPVALDDLDDFAAIFADPEVVRYIGDGRPRPRERVEIALRNGLVCWDRYGYGPFAVVESGRVVGDCVLFPIARSGIDTTDFDARGPEVEIGYRLARSAWGRGIATEAAAAVLEWATGVPGPRLREVLAVTFPENLASQRVLEKIGMQRVGETRDYYDTVTVLFRTTAEPMNPDQ